MTWSARVSNARHHPLMTAIGRNLTVLFEIPACAHVSTT